MSHYHWETYDARVDDQLVARLIASPPAAPTWEKDVALRAIRLARSRLRLPDRILIRWHRPSGRDSAVGAAEPRDGEYVIHLGLGLYEQERRDEFAFLVLHECRHVHDQHAGRERDHFDRLNWELDAEDFAREMLPYWRSGTVPVPVPEPEDEEDEEDEDQAQATRATRPLEPALVPRQRSALGLVEDISFRLGRLNGYFRDGHTAWMLRAARRQVEELRHLVAGMKS